jgi:hypothetical protein
MLQVILQQQRTAKRLTPVAQPWADGSMRQFPFARLGILADLWHRRWRSGRSRSALKLFDLLVDRLEATFFISYFFIFAYKMKSSSSFSIKTHNFCK